MYLEQTAVLAMCFEFQHNPINLYKFIVAWYGKCTRNIMWTSIWSWTC